MLAGDPDKAAAVAVDLNNVQKHLSHGAVIDAVRADEMGLKIRMLPPGNDLWEALWRLYVDLLVSLATSGQRIFEGRRASLLV